MAMIVPVFIVVEDGHEYTERFNRFLSDEIRFERASHLGEAVAALQDNPHAGLLLDLDFRRAPPGVLVDEAGQVSLVRSDGERRRLAEIQGILILRALRAADVRAPALLFADLDDPGQARFLGETLGPLAIVASHAPLSEIRRRMREMRTVLG